MARRRQKSRKKSGPGAAFALLLLLAVFIASGAAWLLLIPYGPRSETFVELQPGSSTAQIAAQLQDAGVIRSQYGFVLLRWIKRGKLKAGEYRFEGDAALVNVYARIARGDVYTKAVTIPEGASIFEIAARLEQAGLGDRQDFLDAAVSEKSLIADLDPKAKSLEGYLFPDTYLFPHKATPAQIYAAMVRRFRAKAEQLGLSGDIHKVVTMASLVERETAVDAERSLVASVFENRLAKKMPLMTDPSVIYGLEVAGKWRGTIYKSDLQLDTPYNTYLHAGLPPGPVANPGVKSLRAAMEPAQTNYLYFVAAGANAQGASHFAATLDEHNRNVADYRHAVKQAGGR